MADPVFGFLTQLVGIHFPSLWLVIEGTNDPLAPGELYWAAWSAPNTVPSPVVGPTGGAGTTSIVDSKLQTPNPKAYLNVAVPQSAKQPVAPDPSPALNFTGPIEQANAAWTFPRPSYLETGNTGVRGVAFFNLGLLAPNNTESTPFQMTMLEGPTGSDVSPQFKVRASLWTDPTSLKYRFSNGALSSLGKATFVGPSGPFTDSGAISQATLTGAMTGGNPKVFVFASPTVVRLTNPSVSVPVPTFVTDVTLFLVVTGAGGALIPPTFDFFIIASSGGGTFPPTNTSNDLSVGDQGNRIQNFSDNFLMAGLTPAQSAGTYFLVIKMSDNGGNAAAAALTVDPSSTLTITQRPTGGGSPTTTTYTLDNTVFPFGGVFLPANIVSPPSANPKWLVVQISPQSGNKFVLGWLHETWLTAAPH